MAAGILAIGFMLIAMVFPVGIKLTASATENTIGVVAYEEAKAKLKIYAGYPNTIDFTKFAARPTRLMLFEDVLDDTNSIFFTDRHAIFNKPAGYFVRERFYEMLYPSRDYCYPGHYEFPLDVIKYRTHTEEAMYRWSVLCAETDLFDGIDEVETLILVTRKINKNARFPVPQWDTAPTSYGYVDPVLNQDVEANYGPDVYPYPMAGYWPMPVRINLTLLDANLRVWGIDASSDPNVDRYINKGDTVINSYYNKSIRYCQVIDKDRHGVTLDGDLALGASNGDKASVWVVPPAAGSSRSPLVGVYSGGSIVFN